MATIINLQRERILRNQLDVWQKAQLVEKHTKLLIAAYVERMVKEDGINALKSK